MWSKKKKKRAIDTIFTYGEPHKTWLVRGGFATVWVVLFRLAMPWPLRGVIEVVFPKGTESGKLLVDYLPAWGDPVIWLGGFYLLVAFGLGLSELFQRVNIMRFASNTVHDMRAAAVRGVRERLKTDRVISGDAISRVIGDSARIKAGLSGIMVHGLQNGLLFVLVCAVMLYISLLLGMIFLLAGLVALYIGLSTSSPVARNASKQRRREGDYATAIQEGMASGDIDARLEEINSSSARKEVRTTKIITLSSLYVHVVLAAAVGVALWYGARGVKAGSIAPGELFLFIAYALTVHRRMVQVGRQAARTGKVLACADRIGAFTTGPYSATPTPLTHAFVPLKEGITLERVKLSSSHGRGAPARLKRTDLVIRPEQSVAVLGAVGSGKSSLLRVLAGAEPPDKGVVRWDGEDMSKQERGLTSRVAFLASDPVFPPTHLWRLIGLKGPGGVSADQEQTLKKIGVFSTVRSFPKGLGKKISSTTVSRNEARLLRLSGMLLGDTSSVWVLDNPSQGLRRRRAAKCLEEIFRCAMGRTLVMALIEPMGLERFDRVLHMGGGKVRFDGTPAEYLAWKKAKKADEKKARAGGGNA